MIKLLYNWRDDVYDVTDKDDIKALSWDSETVDSAFYAAGETIAAQDGSDPLDEAADIIGQHSNTRHHTAAVTSAKKNPA